MFTIDRYSPIAIYEQLISQFERLILHGLLEGNTQLPSVRSLSQELSINPNTVQKTYLELENRGLCFAVPGTGRFITMNAAEILKNEKSTQLTDLRILCGELATLGIPLNTVQEIARAGYEDAIASREEQRNNHTEGKENV